MLLKNYVVELGLFNGAVGTLKSLHFETSEGPDAEELKGYAIVDFPKSTIPENDKLLPTMDRTCVPVPTVCFRCEKNCCTMVTFPLRIAVAITAHKSQGMTIAEDEPFEYAVMHYPEPGTRAPPLGLEHVMTTRPKNLANFCIGNLLNDLDKNTIKRIGKSDGHDKRRAYQNELKQIYKTDKIRMEAEIGEMDPSGNSSYDAGRLFLLQWYRDQFP